MMSTWVTVTETLDVSINLPQNNHKTGFLDIHANIIMFIMNRVGSMVHCKTQVSPLCSAMLFIAWVSRSYIPTRHQLTVPMLESENVPPERSCVPSLPSCPSAMIRFSSPATWSMLRLWTFLTLGTSKPSLVSMAKPMLCDALIQNNITCMFFL